MYIVTFSFLDNRREDYRFWNKQALPECHLLLIYLCMQFRFIGVAPRCLNFAEMSQDSLSNFML